MIELEGVGDNVKHGMPEEQEELGDNAHYLTPEDEHTDEEADHDVEYRESDTAIYSENGDGDGQAAPAILLDSDAWNLSQGQLEDHLMDTEHDGGIVSLGSLISDP